MLRQFTRFRRDGRADKQSAIRRMQDFGYDVIMRRKALRFSARYCAVTTDISPGAGHSSNYAEGSNAARGTASMRGASLNRCSPG